MAGLSYIEWTEATWNPLAGCAMASPGCTNCYAQRMAARLAAMGVEKYSGTTRKSGRRVMEKAFWHSFQILTKRPERMRDVLRGKDFSTLPNVWLGTSVESQEYVGRIDMLRETPAHVRFVSFEPLIGPVIAADLSGVHWVIVGGESGPGARPMEAWWVEKLRDACSEQDVAFFFKQWGGVRKGRSGRTLAGRTWDEYPVLAVRS
ncbi:MAG: phage Gp37/Gp68 family protein [Methylocystis sp.]|nr:phage Gp37/Gp68 family protein [Methylocystis sp.]